MNVLILEDDEVSQEIIGSIMNNKVNLLQTYNLEEAERMFDENKGTLDVVALDGNVPNNSTIFKNTVELTEYIRRNFNGFVL